VFPPRVEEPALLGSKCTECGFVVWPKQGTCPKCFSIDVEEVPLSRKGKVWSSTVVRQAPGDYHGPVPYAVGVVELPEGAGVRTVFAGVTGDSVLPVGTEVELVFEQIGEDENGAALIGHKFRPVSS
jgi:uncharacterized OB-fold protein